MRIKFLKPAPGYAYSEGMLGDLPEEDAKLLIENGYAGEAVDGVITDLPEDFPMRKLLINEGFGMLKDVAENLESIKDLKGVGEKTYKEIVERINS